MLDFLSFFIQINHMFKISVLTISNPNKSSDLDRYLKRIKIYCQFQIIDLAPINRKNNPNTNIFKTLETQQLLDKALNLKNPILPLDEHGKNWTSLELSNNLAKWQQVNKGITFLIGGADGLDLDLLEQQQIHQYLSLSKLTLPHQMAKLILTEQIYRAYTILNHHPYHRT